MKSVKQKLHPSNNPQHINSDVWYYENKGSLDFVVYVDGKCTQFRVSSRKLMTSLRRQGKIRA